MGRKKLTVYDYLQCKGKRQLSVMFVHNAEEAAAAEEAGIDMICTSHDAPQYGVFNSFEELKRIREHESSMYAGVQTANVEERVDADDDHEVVRDVRDLPINDVEITANDFSDDLEFRRY